MKALDGTRTWISTDIVPVRRRFVAARPDGAGLLVRRRLARKGFRLNKTAKAIWSLCDGQTPVASIIEELEHTFKNADGSMVPDVMATLIGLEDNGLLTFRKTSRNERGTRRIDLRQIPFYVINCRQDTAKRDHIGRQLDELGLKFEFVEGTVCRPGYVGTALSHLRILNRKRIETPFGILEDDCLFNEHFHYDFTVPNNTDAFYPGVSRWGIEVPEELSPVRLDQVQCRSDHVQWIRYDEHNLRVFNMLGAHAILYLSDAFRQAALAANIDALLNYENMFPGDVGMAAIHPSYLVLTPLEPICYQAGENRKINTGTLAFTDLAPCRNR